MEPRNMKYNSWLHYLKNLVRIKGGFFLKKGMSMRSSEQQKMVYTYIGQRIRERRKILKLNQSQLAELMGFSYQQMQKYETGSSNISAGKLLWFAKILNVPPSYFYDGLNVDDTIGKRIETSVIQKTRTEKLRVLLVDDNPADVVLFKKALSCCKEQAELHVIYEADQVMDFLQHHALKYSQRLPDVIMLELSLPKVSGFELLRSIKKFSKTAELPVVILTHSISIRDLMDSYRQGAAGFIQKSVNLEEYSECLEIVLKYWSKAVALPVM